MSLECGGSVGVEGVVGGCGWGVWLVKKGGNIL